MRGRVCKVRVRVQVKKKDEALETCEERASMRP